MEFQKITENVENIRLLADTPAISVENLKKEFDKGNKTIKEKFNLLVDNLNDMDLQAYILYESENGTNTNITLSESADNYQYIEVYGHRVSNSIYAKTKYKSGNFIMLNYSRYVDTSFYTYSLELKIEGTSVTRVQESLFYCSDAGTPHIQHGSTDIYIDKIIGYKARD